MPKNTSNNVVDIETAMPKINGYELQGELGKGAMATVYRAKRNVDGKEVAIKVLHNYVESIDAHAKERFIQEATFTLGFNHPSLVKTYEISKANDDSMYMVMDLVSGNTLNEIVENKKNITPEKALKIIAQINEGLIYLNTKNIIHRDIKPSNIVVSDDGSRALLMDFGIARSAEQGNDLTSAGSIVGTPNYISPEQVSGDKLSIKSDVYSLGICLFFMLTGSAPFTSKKAMGVMMMHLKSPLPVLPNDYGMLNRLLKEMCEKKPKKRLSPEALKVELNKLLKNKKLIKLKQIHFNNKNKQKSMFTTTLIESNKMVRKQKIKRIVGVLVVVLVSVVGYLNYSNIQRFVEKSVATLETKDVNIADKITISIRPSRKQSNSYINNILMGDGDVNNVEITKGEYSFTSVEFYPGSSTRWYGSILTKVKTQNQIIDVEMVKQFDVNGVWVSQDAYENLHTEEN